MAATLKEQIDEIMRIRYPELLEPLIPVLRTKAGEEFVKGNDRRALELRSLANAAHHRVMQLQLPETPDVFSKWLSERGDSYPIRRRYESPWPRVKVALFGGGTGEAEVRPHSRPGVSMLYLLDATGREDTSVEPQSILDVNLTGFPPVFRRMPRRE